MSSHQVNELVDQVFRRESGRLIARLTARYGQQNIDLAEDAVHDALVRALKLWPFHGVPREPVAWLSHVANNRCIDNLRRLKKQADFDDQNQAKQPDEACFQGEIDDDRISMAFATCHPSFSAESRIALTLKLVFGFSTSEIGRALRMNESTVAQRIVRCKRKFRSGDIGIKLPDPSDLDARLESVLEVFYAMFNEAHHALAGDELMREDMALECLYLLETLAEHKRTASPATDALAALMHFSAARFPARLGHLTLLQQDRSKWDKQRIGRGVVYLGRSARGSHRSRYHIEAEIASLHTLADCFEATDWRRIIDLYDQLITRFPSPIAQLNRAVAIAFGRSFGQGLAELNALETNLHDYDYFYLVKAELLYRTQGASADVQASFEQARLLCRNESVSLFIDQRQMACQSTRSRP